MNLCSFLSHNSLHNKSVGPLLAFPVPSMVSHSYSVSNSSSVPFVSHENSLFNSSSPTSLQSSSSTSDQTNSLPVGPTQS